MFEVNKTYACPKMLSEGKERGEGGGGIDCNVLYTNIIIFRF